MGLPLPFQHLFTDSNSEPEAPKSPSGLRLNIKYVSFSQQGFTKGWRNDLHMLFER